MLLGLRTCRQRSLYVDLARTRRQQSCLLLQQFKDVLPSPVGHCGELIPKLQIRQKTPPNSSCQQNLRSASLCIHLLRWRFCTCRRGASGSTLTRPIQKKISSPKSPPEPDGTPTTPNTPKHPKYLKPLKPYKPYKLPKFRFGCRPCASFCRAWRSESCGP